MTNNYSRFLCSLAAAFSTRQENICLKLLVFTSEWFRVAIVKTRNFSCSLPAQDF